MESTSLTTAGKPAKIKLVADRPSILANGQDLCFVTVEITDEQDHLQPNADHRLSFDLEGPGVIVGLDNANLKDLDPYVGTIRRAWHGRALVVIKGSHTPGNIKLTVTSPGLSQANLNLKTSEP